MTIVSTSAFTPFQTYPKEAHVAASKIQAVVRRHAEPPLRIRAIMDDVRSTRSVRPYLLEIFNSVQMTGDSRADTAQLCNFLASDKFRAYTHEGVTELLAAMMVLDSIIQSLDDATADTLDNFSRQIAQLYLGTRIQTFMFANELLNKTTSFQKVVYDAFSQAGEKVNQLGLLLPKIDEVIASMQGSYDAALSEFSIDLEKIMKHVFNPSKIEHVKAGGKVVDFNGYLDKLLQKTEGLSNEDGKKVLKALIAKRMILGGIAKGEKLFADYLKTDNAQLRNAKNARDIHGYMFAEDLVQELAHENTYIEFSDAVLKDRMPSSQLLSHLQKMFGTLESVPNEIQNLALRVD